MAAEYEMPKLGLTMESATILRWLIPDRTQVTAGQAVVLVETDKVETEIAASHSGVLHQTGEVGENYECGVRIGWFTEPGELPPTEALPTPRATVQAAERTEHPDPRKTPATSPASVASGRILASPAAKRLARELSVELTAVTGSGASGRITERDVRAAQAASKLPVPTASRHAQEADAASTLANAAMPPATFAARQLADLLGLDLRVVQPSAADGRISRTDVAGHIRQLLARVSTPSDPETSAGTSEQVHTAASPDAETLLSQQPTEMIPLRGMRAVIAERMKTSLHTMAQLTLTMDVDMSSVVAQRAALTERVRVGDGDAGSTGGSVPGITDYIVAATAAALRAHPRVNSQVTSNSVALLEDIHIGLAVALEDGLLVPVIRHADRLSLSAIGDETTRLANGARQGSLGYDDYQGATFTVTALGAFGVDAFTPIVNTPNTAILGVGRIRNETVWLDGAPSACPVLTLSLTWDHRAFDGAPAARFAGSIRDWLESL